MIVIWRGLGWLVPVIYVLSAFFVTFLSKLTLEDYVGRFLVEMMVVIIAAILVALLGYRVNIKGQEKDKKATKYKILKGSNHALFLIPVQYWALIILFLFGSIAIERKEHHAITSQYILSPQIDDVYAIDFSIIEGGLGEENRYGAMKVIYVNNDLVKFCYGDYGYAKKRKLYQALDEGNEFSGYEEAPFVDIVLTRSELLSYFASKAILRIIRDKD